MKAGGTAIAVGADLEEEARAAGLFETATKRLGPVDILVNNAGQNFPLTPLLDISLAEWGAMFRDNLISMFLCTRIAGADMRELLAAAY